MEKEILVVDDERDICEVLDISLSDIGYQVHTAENGEEALRVFEKVSPPIVLTVSVGKLVFDCTEKLMYNIFAADI